ncbi:hypothetical protein Poly51_35240 [Rubripirellula tenax]|uniref:Uncharacterized protein n=1 Tax=Rubripirellula tenax TaxID=2528015 RepID=A0A5C6F173_9BACT|nr:hypothetical protein [Rubripirellula tenax]TWU54805.1 hypothetical protein Poly51_35240 [Rubripirellula tenax]
MMNEKRTQNIAALLIRGLSRVQKVKREQTAVETTDGEDVSTEDHAPECSMPAGGER